MAIATSRSEKKWFVLISNSYELFGDFPGRNNGCFKGGGMCLSLVLCYGVGGLKHGTRIAILLGGFFRK